MRSTIFLVAVLLLNTSSQAATWTVEKDGSGDFTVIQDALDAASDGDSVLVGPGRYSDFQFYRTIYSDFPIHTIAMIRKDVSLIGSGRDSTIIGPEEFVFEIEDDWPVCMYVDEGAEPFIEGMAFDNARGFVTIASKMTMVDCRLDGRDKPRNSSANLVILDGEGTSVSDSEFLGPLAVSANSPASNWVIENSTAYDETGDGTGIIIRSYNALVRNCEIEAGIGVTITAGGFGTIEGCSIDGGVTGGGVQSDVGLAIVRDCLIKETRQPLRCGNGRLEVYDSIVQGGVPAGGGPGLTIAATSEVIVRNSHLLNGGDLTVLGPSDPTQIVDVRENWWGTTDLDLIYSWIENQADNVLVEPIAEGPVDVKPSTVGSLKARFAPR